MGVACLVGRGGEGDWLMGREEKRREEGEGEGRDTRGEKAESNSRRLGKQLLLTLEK